MVLEGTLAHTKTVSGPVSVPHLIYSSRQITSSLWTAAYLATNRELVSPDFLGVGHEQKPGIRCLARARQVPGDLRILHHLVFKLFFSFYRSGNTYPRSHSKEHRLRAGDQALSSQKCSASCYFQTPLDPRRPLGKPSLPCPGSSSFAHTIVPQLLREDKQSLSGGLRLPREDPLFLTCSPSAGFHKSIPWVVIVPAS